MCTRNTTFRFRSIISVCEQHLFAALTVKTCILQASCRIEQFNIHYSLQGSLFIVHCAPSNYGIARRAPRTTEGPNLLVASSILRLVSIALPIFKQFCSYVWLVLHFYAPDRLSARVTIRRYRADFSKLCQEQSFSVLSSSAVLFFKVSLFERLQCVQS